MARETTEQKRARASIVVKLLREEFPEPACALIHEGPFQLLVATILSAQCTDARVNLVTPSLFKKAPDATAMVKLGEPRIRELVKSINFFNNKAHNIHRMSQILVERYGGKVPPDLDALVELPGVGRKTANVVLGTAFGVPGLVVDTHVRRITHLLRLTNQEDPVKIEAELEKLIPRVDWVDFSHLLILHGRKTCIARRPDCAHCVLLRHCPSSLVR